MAIPALRRYSLPKRGSVCHAIFLIILERGERRELHPCFLRDLHAPQLYFGRG